MSTNPVGVVHVPTPAIVMVTPVPDVSVTFHDSRTVTWFPVVTVEGAAVNEFMVGGGHALTVTVVVAVAWLPQFDLTIS